MFSKLIVVALIAIVAAAPQHQYPAGLDASKCPGYPICDNVLLHYDTLASWNRQPQPTINVAPLSNEIFGPGGDKYPAGLSPASCPNYPYCDVGITHNGIAVAPLPGFNERQYPAGVPASSCPNFPFCN